MPLRFRHYLIPPAPSTHLPKTKQETMSQTQNSVKNRNELWTSKFVEKMRKQKLKRRSLASVSAALARRGNFCWEHFLYELSNTQLLCDFCINSALTKFHLVLFCFYLPNVLHRDKVYLWNVQILVKNFWFYFVF